jgi:hypothetical protein
MQVKRQAEIYKRSLPSGNTTFRVDMGTINGKRMTKDFRHEVEALKCKRNGMPKSSAVFSARCKTWRR